MSSPTKAETLPEGRVDRRRQRTRSAIMAAGQQLFANRSIDSVSIDEIADAADVAKGSFYNHFADKDALGDAVLDLIGGDCEFHIQSANHGVADPAMRVARALCVMIRYALDHPERVQAIISLSQRRTVSSSALNAGMTRDIAAGLAERRFSAIDVETGILLVLGLVNVTVEHLVTSATTTRPHDLAVRMSAALLRALGVREDEAQLLAAAAADLLGDR